MLFNKKCCAPMPTYNCCNNMMPQMQQNCCGMDPIREQCIVEPTINKCVEKEFYHEVPHVCPIHTHVINRHIYNHSYTPEYSCSEENQVCNIDNGPCCKFV